MTDTPRLETERLILRFPCEDDFEDWARVHADPGVARFTTGAPLNRNEAWRYLASIIGHWAIRGYGFFSVIEKASGRWIGRIGPWCPEGWPAPEIGWTLDPQVQGRGFATEAARACMDQVVDDLGWSHVIHLILEGNHPSERVAAALGSAVERRIDDFHGYGPARVWGQSAEAWRARRGA